jgi:hypothetical protein
MRKYVLTLSILTLFLAGCTEQSTGAKADQPSSATANNGYVATDASWKSGDKSSWSGVLKNRAQGQNDYLRSKPL